MKKLEKTLSINLAFASALAILAAIGWLSYRNTTAMIESDHWEDNAYAEIKQLDGLFSALKDAEAGQRGFIITGQEKYLEPYNKALSDIDGRLAYLKRLIADDPQQQKRVQGIESLIRGLLAELQETIELRRTRGFEAAFQAVMTDKGKAGMDEIRARGAEIQAEEWRLLQERARAKATDARRAIQALVAGSILSFALLLTVFLLLKREIALRVSAEKDLLINRDHLQEVVGLRTEELERANALLRGEILEHKEAEKTLHAEIDERRRAEAALQESERNLAEAQRIAHIGSWEWNLKTDEARWSDELYRIFGLEPRSVVVTPRLFMDFIHPDDRERAMEAMNQARLVGTAANLDLRIVLPDGSVRMVHDEGEVVEFDEAMVRHRMIGTVQDITERKRMEAAVGRSEALLRAVSENTEDAIYAKDLDSRLLLVNPAALRLVGKPAEEIIGHTDAEFYDDPAIGAAILENDRRVVDSGVPQLIEETVDTPRGRRIMLSSKVPWRDGSGRVIGIIGISRDVTERKQMEDELRRGRDELELRVQERTAELSHVVDTLQDEVVLRTSTEQALRERSDQLRLLASQLTLAEQRERQRLAQVLHDGLQQILVAAKFRVASIERANDEDLQQATAEVAELIDSAIETSRSLTAELSPPILREFGLIPALEWLARWMYDKHGLALELRAHGQAGPVAEDVTVLLFQATRELLLNVVKHAGVKAARVQVTRLDGRIQVTVADEGAGFDPTQIRAAGGSTGGFGLFSVHERLNLLGGQMEIDSAPGRGSRITLVAPASTMEERPGAAPLGPELKVSVGVAPLREAATAGEERKIRILLVEDHIVMRQGLARLLREEPDVDIVGEASDGEAAVRLVRDVQPDVVLMDISMPRMNGIQATQIIHAELPDVRVIGLSMFDEGERAAAIREAGAVGYLTKSGPSDAVIAAIRACVSPSARTAAKQSNAV